MFAGKSTLRAKETTTAKVDPVLQAYLKRYESSGANGSSGAGNGGDGKKKRKKKKPALSALAGGVRIVDESVTGFAPATAAAAQPAEDEDDDDDYGEATSAFHHTCISSHMHFIDRCAHPAWPSWLPCDYATDPTTVLTP